MQTFEIREGKLRAVFGIRDNRVVELLELAPAENVAVSLEWEPKR